VEAKLQVQPIQNVTEKMWWLVGIICYDEGVEK
jgi:hypothetical protein